MKSFEAIREDLRNIRYYYSRKEDERDGKNSRRKQRFENGERL